MASIDAVIKSKGPSEQTLLGGRLRLFKGTVQHWLPTFGRLFFDACLVDPPYELNFMGATWDRSGVAFDPATWQMVFRTLKPGAHLMTYGGTRTFHRIMVAVEDAGFEFIDTMMFMHGQGFPKGQEAGKAIDKKKGRTESDDSKRWDGYNTCLKPAYEPLAIFRRPLVGTYVDNILLYDTGGLNIAPCRIGSDTVTVRGGGANHYAGVKSFLPYNAVNISKSGRYPSNVVLSHHPMCRKVGHSVVKGDARAAKPSEPGKRPGGFANVGHANGDGKPNGKVYGAETVEKWSCVSGCPVRMLNKQSGVTESKASTNHTDKPNFKNKVYGKGMGGTVSPQNQHNDKGGCSRFFYIAKVSRAEREAGLHGEVLKDADNFGDDEWGKENRKVAKAANNHACLKSIDLNRYFATLILPPERKTPRRILVPFAGVCSEVIGALLAGWDEVWAVEMDGGFVKIGAKRAKHWLSDAVSSNKEP